MPKKEKPPIISLLSTLTEGGIKTINEIESDTNRINNLKNIYELQSNIKENLITVSPFLCKPWYLADRLEVEMGNIEELSLSIQKNGQQEPILIRPIKPNQELSSKIKYEIIFGNRRWKACCLINKPIKAIIRNISDQEAAICQKEENSYRRNLSDYSRCLSYEKLLAKNIFNNLTQLAIKMNIPKQTISDIMSYSRIDKKILDAIPEPHKLSRNSAIKLAKISSSYISKNELNIIIENAEKINFGIIPAKNIENLLFKKSKLTPKPNIIKTIKNSQKKKIFTIHYNAQNNLVITTSKHITNTLSINKISEKLLKEFDFLDINVRPPDND